jgi:exopolysaccharide biosynthesis polyprenyl glycosylphosphotransferase
MTTHTTDPALAVDPAQLASAADESEHAAARATSRRLEVAGAWLVWGFDLAMAALAWHVASLVRVAWSSQLGPMISFTSGSDVPHWVPEILFLALYSIGLYANGCLNSERPIWVVPRQVTAAIMALVLFLGLSYLFQWLTVSRAFLGVLFLALTTAIGVGWVVLRLARRVLQRWGLGVSRVLVVGAAEDAAWVLRELARARGSGVRVAGLVSDDPALADPERQRRAGVRVLPGVANAASWASRLRADQVVLCCPDWPRRRIAEALEELWSRGLRVYVHQPELAVHLGSAEEPQNLFRGTELVDFGAVRARPVRDSKKRVFDLVVGSALFLVCLPVFVAIAAAILITDGRPVFYRQERCGHAGRRFRIWKFRTMRVGADQEQDALADRNEMSGPIFKIRNDPRVTALGSFLRRHSLDELPQLWNVLRGEMSLVGPRPPLPAEVERYEPWHRARLSGVIGCSGLWQVSGRSDLPFDDMVMLDLYYLRHTTVRMDVKILVRTFWVVVVGEGAY